MIRNKYTFKMIDITSSDESFKCHNGEYFQLFEVVKDTFDEALIELRKEYDPKVHWIAWVHLGDTEDHTQLFSNKDEIEEIREKFLKLEIEKK